MTEKKTVARAGRRPLVKQRTNQPHRSNQVSWWSVHEWAAPLLQRVGSWPMVGTPEWCDLADDDPRKLAACIDASRHWALRIETCQDALAEASRAVSAAEDWPAVAQRLVSGRGDSYVQRRAS